MISPAPTLPQRPDSAACSSAHGAGVQFARLPCVERVFGIVARLLMYGGPPSTRVNGLSDVLQPGVNIAERRFQNFATDPLHGMRARDCLPAKTMLTGTQRTVRVGGIPFQQVPARAGDIGATVGAC